MKVDWVLVGFLIFMCVLMIACIVLIIRLHLHDKHQRLARYEKEERERRQRQFHRDTYGYIRLEIEEEEYVIDETEDWVRCPSCEKLVERVDEHLRSFKTGKTVGTPWSCKPKKAKALGSR